MMSEIKPNRPGGVEGVKPKHLEVPQERSGFLGRQVDVGSKDKKTPSVEESSPVRMKVTPEQEHTQAGKLMRMRETLAMKELMEGFEAQYLMEPGEMMGFLKLLKGLSNDNVLKIQSYGSIYEVRGAIRKYQSGEIMMTALMDETVEHFKILYNLKLSMEETWSDKGGGETGYTGEVPDLEVTEAKETPAKPERAVLGETQVVRENKPKKIKNERVLDIRKPTFSDYKAEKGIEDHEIADFCSFVMVKCAERKGILFSRGKKENLAKLELAKGLVKKHYHNQELYKEEIDLMNEYLLAYRNRHITNKRRKAILKAFDEVFGTDKKTRRKQVIGGLMPKGVDLQEVKAGIIKENPRGMNEDYEVYYQRIERLAYQEVKYLAMDYQLKAQRNKEN